MSRTGRVVMGLLLPLAARPAVALQQRVIIAHETRPQSLITRTETDARERQNQLALGTAAAVDLTGVWYHLRRNDIAAARFDLDRLRAEHPGWTPPLEVVGAVRLAELRQIAAHGEQASAVRLRSLSEGLDACAEPDVAWFLIDRGILAPQRLLEMARRCRDAGVAVGSLDRHLQQIPRRERRAVVAAWLGDEFWSEPVRRFLRETAFTLDVAELSETPAGELTPDRLSRVGAMIRERRHAGGAVTLGWVHLRRGERDEALGWFESARSWGAGEPARAGQAEAFFADAMAAAQAGDTVHALVAARQSAAHGRGNAWEDLGWTLLAYGHPEAAFRAFSEAPATEDALYGRVLALKGTGRADAAADAACASALNFPRLRGACTDLLAEQIVTAYDQRRYADVVALADRLAATSPERTDVLPLVAWSYLHQQNAAAAARLFERLYAEGRDRSAAEGWVTSLHAAGEAGRLKALRKTDSLVNAIAAEWDGRVAYARKQFDLARRLAPEVAPLGGADAWSGGLGAAIGTTGSSVAAGRLRSFAMRTSATGMLGRLRLGVDVVRVRLSSDVVLETPPLAGSAGSSPQPQEVILPELAARLERPGLTLLGRVSSTPLNAAVRERLTGALELTVYADPFALHARAFSLPIGSSMVALAGVTDSSSGLTWGRVVDTGVGGQVIWSGLGPWSAALSAERAIQQGENVADNHRTALRGDVGFSMAPPGFETIRVGPFLSWSRYARNLGRYSYGHGGYFSPRLDLRGGLSMESRTRQGGRAQVRLSASLGYGRADEVGAARFPLTPEAAAPFDPVTTIGLMGDGMLQGALLVTPKTLLFGFARFARTPGYEAAEVGVMVRVAVKPLAGLFGDDHPGSLNR